MSNNNRWAFALKSLSFPPGTGIIKGYEFSCQEFQKYFPLP